MSDTTAEISESTAFERGLPKWPQMLVTGKSISVAQAKEIIFATDTGLTLISRFSGGNDRAWRMRFRRATGYEQLDADVALGLNATTEERETYIARTQEASKREQQFLKAAQFLRTEYVHNSWADCAFIYGPYGWCHADGTIGYSDNVGKWPSVQKIAEEWKLIAARWPFIDAWVTLMSGESCEESQPVVTLRILNGKVSYQEGTLAPHAPAPARELEPSRLRQFTTMDYSDEHGLPAEWIDEFAARVRPIVEAVVARSREDSVVFDIVSSIPVLSRLRYFPRTSQKTWSDRGFQSKRQACDWITEQHHQGRVDWQVGLTVKFKGSAETLEIVDKDGRMPKL